MQRCVAVALWLLANVAGRVATAQSAVPAGSEPASAAALTFEQIKAAAGSFSVKPGPLASDLSPAMTHGAIDHAISKVADWQLQQSAGSFNQDWTYAPLYLGLMAASRATGDRRYHDPVLRAAEGFQWKLWQYRGLHADDEVLGQVYEALYLERRDPERIADTRATLTALLARPKNPARDLWWWCDALYMAPPALVKMAEITGDRRFIAGMDAEWELTQAHLYDPAEHLFTRDASFLAKTEPNGKKLFWARGNGWVLAGLADVLKTLPKTDPARPGYEALFRQMAARVAALQGTDGLWRPGLLDREAYPLPEVSGSAFFAYAMAWGIHNGLLDRGRFLPVARRAWAGMLGHVYADGRLGCIQPIGAAPDAYSASSSYVYGVGAFLLAGAELERLAADGQ